MDEIILHHYPPSPVSEKVRVALGIKGLSWRSVEIPRLPPKPDVMPLAKGLGSGVPVGALVCGPKAANVFGPGNHGTTFGGNPLAMRAGVETIRIMEEDGILANAASVGAALKGGLERELSGVDGVVEIRGQGLMLGIELDRPCGVILGRAAEAGLMLSVTADKVIRLVPPLILTADEAGQMVAILAPIIKGFLKEAVAEPASS